MITFIGWLLMFITEVAQLLCGFMLVALFMMVADKEVKEIEKRRKDKANKGA